MICFHLSPVFLLRLFASIVTPPFIYTSFSISHSLRSLDVSLSLPTTCPLQGRNGVTCWFCSALHRLASSLFLLSFRPYTCPSLFANASCRWLPSYISSLPVSCPTVLESSRVESDTINRFLSSPVSVRLVAWLVGWRPSWCLDILPGYTMSVLGLLSFCSRLFTGLGGWVVGWFRPAHSSEFNQFIRC
jgi:hypothetical protein